MPTVTWDSVNKGTSVTLSNGNLTALVPNNLNTVRATEGKTNGKWYLEIRMDSLNNAMVGIVNDLASLNSANYGTSNVRYYYGNGTKYAGGLAYGASYATGDIISILLDLNLGTIEFWKNGVSQGVAFTDVLSLGKVYPAITSGSSNSGSSVTARFNVKEFTYRMPDGYLAYDGSRDIKNKILLSSNEKAYSLLPKETKHETKMTSNTAPAPFIASASSINSSTFPAWKAFNGSNLNNTDCWATADKIVSGNIQIDFGTQKKINKVYITNRNGTDVNSSPKDFDVLGSNDGIDFKSIIEIRSQIDWKQNETREFYFMSDVSYRHFILKVLSNNGGIYTAIGEILYSYETVVSEIPNTNEQNLIKYGMDSPVQLDGIFSSKNYILQDTVSENAEGLWTTQLNRKPLSIKFERK